MSDVLTITDLQTAKKHDTFHSEVITGKAGGLASGASIDTATNAVTGQVQTTLPKVLRDLGAMVQTWTATTGGTLTDAGQVFLNDITTSAGKGNYYAWTGAFPKVVATGTDPAAVAGYVPRTDVILRSDLASESGSELVGYQPAGTGAVATTVQSKMLESVSVFDFMTSAQIADSQAGTASIDVTSAIQAAINYAQSVGSDVKFPAGKYKVNGGVSLKNKVGLIGTGKAASEIYFGAGGKFELAGSSGSSIGYLKIADLGLTNQGGGAAYCLNLNYAVRVLIHNCVVYNSSIGLSAFNYITIDSCDLYGGQIYADHPDLGGISEALKLSNINASGYEVNVRDTADFVVDSCSFLGPTARVSVYRGEQNAAFYPPVFINNTIIDSGDNEGLILSGVAPHINNCFISSGRVNLKSGISMYDCVEGAIINTTSRFCGASGLQMNDCKTISVVGCTFNDNKVNGVAIGGCSYLKFTNNTMTNAPAWFGGSYVQVSGIADQPSDSTNIAFIGNKCDGNSTTNIYLPSSTNILVANTGSTNETSLDTYRSGTFTPTVSGGTSAGAGTYAAQTGRYTKIGNVVTVTAYIVVTAHTGTGVLQLTNLPFPSKAGTYHSVNLGYVNNIALSTNNVATAFIPPGATYAKLAQYPIGGGAITDVQIGTAFEIIYTATYLTAV